MNKKDYVIIGGYGKLAVPIDMMEQICREGYVVEERFSNTTNKLEINSIERVTDLKVLYADEFSACVIQQELTKG